jgi:glycosyltransferase involved in cell wall biosynthesis
MIVSFTWPSSHHRTGGVVALYEFANGLARLGHEVNFMHGPTWPDRIDDVEELSWFRFHPGVRHLIVDDFEDPSLPAADVVFSGNAPARLGLPCPFIQGAHMLDEETERATFRLRGPKVCIAQWLVGIGRRYGVPEEQLWHVPMGIDHELFAHRIPAPARRYDVAINYNSHLTKGWHVGLKALHLVAKRRPGLRCVSFGYSPPPEPLPEGTVFLTHPHHRELADDVYNQSLIYVVPSHWEGFGFTAIEAMSCGAALVTTDNGGSEDYAIPDETAWVVPPGDPEALAEGIVTLLDDDDRRAALARAGEDLVRTFDWTHGSAVLAAHLEEYVADPARFQAEPEPGELHIWS